MENIGKIDSKYRFVILASKRAKQLLRGVKPKIKAKSKNLIRIAQTEVSSGLIDFELLPTQKDEIQEREDRAFAGDELVGIVEPDDVTVKAAAEEDLGEDEEEEDEEESEDEDPADEELSGDSEDDLKDE